MPEYTPMMKQYLEIKKEHNDALLFFRLGDFYELFFKDALIVVRELDITLTKKSCGKINGEKLQVDMCGVPFHSVETYIAKLVKRGYKIAICEQMEDAKQVGKKIVNREVVRVITAGTVVDSNLLEETKNNYIMCVFQNKMGFAMSVCDVSTGEFISSDFSIYEKSKIIDEIAKYNPAEIICNSKFELIKKIEKVFKVKLYVCLDFYFDLDNAKITILNHFNITTLSSFDIQDNYMLVTVSGALLRYLIDTQKDNLKHISTLKKIKSKDYMAIDIASRRNLELTETMRDKSKKGSLLWVLDKTNTPMGARLIRKWIEQPLIKKIDIENRLNAVESISKDILTYNTLKQRLSKIRDIERLVTKISYKTANARDLTSLKDSFYSLPEIKNTLVSFDCELLKSIANSFDTLEDLYEYIDISIKEETPFSIREGGLIKDGYNETVDKYNNAKKEGSNWLIQLEEREKEKTGIKSLKVRYNRLFGYYIEVLNSQLSLVPTHYTRKQTLSNCERYITDELQKIEDAILGADERLAELEYEIFCEVRKHIENNTIRIQKTASLIAQIDTLTSFAEVSMKNKYIKPTIIDNDISTLEIKLGRHPVVEAISNDRFIPNDTILDNNDNRLAIITGPNMAGKSTYMRQTALMVLMAQIGCFVPCDSAIISIADRIFTRVGASDDLATGQSTFMIEMNEVANIINNATEKSIVILDEIGRGTSTFDGISIAWAVLEHIANEIKSRTLFATHYHEITEIENKIKGVKNYCVEVKHNGEDIVFLRKIIVGIAKSSYGIHVAKLAGIPSPILERANEILELFSIPNNPNTSLYDTLNLREEKEDDDFCYNSIPNKNKLFFDEIQRQLKELYINNLTPYQAIEKLMCIKECLSKL